LRGFLAKKIEALSEAIIFFQDFQKKKISSALTDIYIKVAAISIKDLGNFVKLLRFCYKKNRLSR